VSGNGVLEMLDDLRRTGSNEAIARIVQRAGAQGLSDPEVAELASVLAASGAMLANRAVAAADIASTGGPSSLTTLLGPLYLASLGYRVPTLAVPGRPAGGIDVLATIPGYRTSLSRPEVEAVLKSSRHAHLEAGATWTPLDAAVFAYRQQMGAQQQPALVIASLLAKKLATRVGLVGLDVRVAGHGNFGADFRSAAPNAVRFVSVARLLGVRAGCLLTDARTPYQPYIGRGEALLALYHLAADSADPWLEEHGALCWQLVESTVGLGSPSRPKRPSARDLRVVLEANLDAQDASWLAFASRCDEIRSQPVMPLRASRSGFVSIDLETIRTVLVEVQRAAGVASDPSGVTLLVRPGALVADGQEIAAVRNGVRLTEQQQEVLCAAFSIGESTGLETRAPVWIDG
jgi:thymidine phosphorylase